MKSGPQWRLFGLWSATLALQRNTIEFWECPRSKRMVVRSLKTGATYDCRRGKAGWYIRRRNLLADELA